MCSATYNVFSSINSFVKKYYFFIIFILFSCTQDPVIPLPNSPTSLSAVLFSATQVDLSWTDNSTNETGFKIDRKIGSGQWLNIGTVGANLVSYSDLGLTINTTYTYRVYAYNSAGNSSSYSNEVSITTVSVPLITTTSISNVTINSASSGGAISNDGGSAITSRGVVWSTATNPTTALPTKTSDGTGTGSFVSAISGLTAGTLYYVRAYATNAIGTGYGSLETFTTQPPSLPTVTTTPITSITLTGASSGGNITSDGGGSVTGRGVVWSTSPNPTIALPTKTSDGTGTGSFVSTISGLTAGTLFYVRAYATNSAGTAYGPQIPFTTTSSSFTCGVSTVTFNYRGAPVTYGTVVGAGGRCWLDRNLGASRVAQSSTDNQSYGDLFQWGRGDDGHQLRNSGTTPTLSSGDQPGHGNFISTGAPGGGSVPPHDWRSPQNINLWQGVNGINNVCPSGWRLPTAAELEAERLSWSTNSAMGAFASPLKLPMAGLRASNGVVSANHVGTAGRYWSSTDSGPDSFRLNFDNTQATVNTIFRAIGFSVRCIKN